MTSNTARWLPTAESPIWQYAKAMGVSLMGVLPKDFQVSYSDGLWVSGTVRTMQEAEALREVIRHLGQTLPSTRKGLAADIGTEPPPYDWHSQLRKALGDPEVRN